MLTTIARYTIWLAMAVGGVLLVLDVLYFAHGSLETLPTAEDHRKVRVVTGIIGIVLTAAEGVLWLNLRGLGRTEIPTPR
ncbi:MAG TPA: hypothetical protein VFR37_25570 [Longimicrobium sp.]|nr:hypothetical protein [Longimicrobium sp.]